MTARPHRYYVLPAGDGPVTGFDNRAGAETAALAYGDGAHLVDTEATPYNLIAEQVEDGALAFLGFGGWQHQPDLESDLIEAIKKGYAPIVRAFLAKGADANGRDAKGGPALNWAVAKRKIDIVALLLAAGADPKAADAGGVTPLALAEKRGTAAIGELLRQAGA